LICDPNAIKTKSGSLRDVDKDSSVLLVMRMQFMIHSFLNLYALQEGTGNCVLGSALPSELMAVHKGAHFMTVDKVVAEAKASSLFTETAGE